MYKSFFVRYSLFSSFKCFFVQSSSGIRVPIGLYSKEVTYFFLNLCVVLKTMTPSLMDNAYKWFNITWLGSGRRVGSQDIGVSWRLNKKSMASTWRSKLHTIRKVKFLSKNSILTKNQHFHEFFIQNFFDNFSREIKVVNS